MYATEKKKFSQLCLYVSFLFLLVAKLHSQSYLIMEQELQQLETIHKTLQVSRQTALEQLKKLQPLLTTLKSESATLQSESTKLSNLLKAERQTVQDLTTSLSAFEVDLQQERIQAAKIQVAYNDELLSHQKTKSQRSILLVILIGLAVASIIGVAIKLFIKFYVR